MTSTVSRPPSRSAATSAGRAPAAEASGLLQRALPFIARLESPVTSYYVLLGTTVILVVIGLVMVLSASMITSYRDDGSAFTVFLDQAKYAAIGVVGAVVAAHLPVRWYQRLALPALLGALVLQCLVFTSLGISVNGNRNWVRFVPGVQVQPSELVKLGLILVGEVLIGR